MSEIKKWMKLVESVEDPVEEEYLEVRNSEDCDCKKINCLKCFPDNTEVVKGIKKESTIKENQWEGDRMDSEYAIQVINGAYEDGLDYESYSREELNVLKRLETIISERHSGEDIDYYTILDILEDPHSRYSVEDPDKFIERVFGNQLIKEPEFFESAGDSAVSNPNFESFDKLTVWLRAVRNAGLQWHIAPPRDTDEGSMYIATDPDRREQGYFFSGGVEQRGVLANSSDAYSQEMGEDIEKLDEVLPILGVVGRAAAKGAASAIGSAAGAAAANKVFGSDEDEDEIEEDADLDLSVLDNEEDEPFTDEDAWDLYSAYRWGDKEPERVKNLSPRLKSALSSFRDIDTEPEVNTEVPARRSPYKSASERASEDKTRKY